MFRTILVFAVLFAVVYGQTAVSQCKMSPGDLPVNVKIGACTKPPCVLPQLQDAILDVEFIAPRNMSLMTTLATAYLSVFGFPYDLGDNSVTCKFLQNSTCPVEKGQTLRYQLKLFVEKYFPVGVQAFIEFRIVDQDLQPVTCLRVPILIEKPVAPIDSAPPAAHSVSDKQVAPVALTAPITAMPAIAPASKVTPVTTIVPATPVSTVTPVTTMTPIVHITT